MIIRNYSKLNLPPPVSQPSYCTYIFIVYLSHSLLHHKRCCIVSALLNDVEHIHVTRKISKSRTGQHSKKKEKTKERNKENKIKEEKYEHEEKEMKAYLSIEVWRSIVKYLWFFHRGNNNTPNCTGSLAGLGGAKSGGNTPMNPSLQQRINFLQSHLSQGPMPSATTK